MKRLFKKIATVVATVAMITAMTTTAFAAEDLYTVAEEVTYVETIGILQKMK